MKVALYGANRVAKDFLYLFDELDVDCCFADEGEDAEAFAAGTGIHCRPVAELQEAREICDRVIVCDFPGAAKDAKLACLEELGYVRGRDYCIEDEMLAALDPHPLALTGKRLVVWGCGRRGEKFDRWNARRREPMVVEGYFDDNPSMQSFHGHSVGRISALLELAKQEAGEVFVLVTMRDYSESLQMLELAGLQPFCDFGTYDDIVYAPSEMARRTIFERKVYDFFCESMLNHAEVTGQDGNVICCCSTFIERNLGTIERMHDFKSCWNSITHRIMCLSNVNRTYTHCLTDMCPLFIGRTTSESYDLARPYPKMEASPKTVAVGYDYTCNLKCVTCREDFRTAKGKDARACQESAEVVERDVLPGCEFLIMAGDGEVLLSPAYRALYTSPAVRHLKWLRLLTNGTLFTPEKWKELRAHTDAKIMMTVSIDAATAETYEQIRRGGHFDQLKKNMEFAAGLRKKGDLSYLRFNFVVQKKNYQEMIPFTEWGKELGIDEVFFTKILNWGMYTKEEFREISMMEEDGLTPKPELQAVLDDPVMKEPIVDLGTIRYHHEGTDEKAIKNYYRWELERKVPGLFE